MSRGSCVQNTLVNRSGEDCCQRQMHICLALRLLKGRDEEMHWALPPWGLGSAWPPGGQTALAPSPSQLNSREQRPSPTRWSLKSLLPYQGLHLYPEQVHKEKIGERTKNGPRKDIPAPAYFPIAYISIESCVCVCVLLCPQLDWESPWV